MTKIWQLDFRFWRYAANQSIISLHSSSGALFKPSFDLGAVISLILPVSVPADTTHSSVAPAGTIEMRAYFPSDEIRRR